MLIRVIGGSGIFCEILRCMSLDLTDDKSTQERRLKRRNTLGGLEISIGHK